MKLAVKDDNDINVDLSPMIDMVFLLLIFFLVASAIVKVEKVDIEIPSAVYAIIPEDTTGRFIITVDQDGKLYVAQNPVTLDELKLILEPELARDEKLRILIRSDGNTKYKFNEKIMMACAEVGANDLIFSAFEE